MRPLIMIDYTQVAMEITDTLPGSLSGSVAVVEEQDTCLLTSLKPVISDTTESYPALVRKMEQQKPLTPGQVLTKYESPIRFIAIVYDIGQQPPCRAEWIMRALQTIFTECGKLEIQTLIMPVLGELHGNTTQDHFRQLLESVIPEPSPAYPRAICLVSRER